MLPRLTNAFPPSPRLAIALIFLTRGFIAGNWVPRIPGIVAKLDIAPSLLGIIWFMLAAGCIVAFSVAARMMTSMGSAKTFLFFSVPYSLILALVSLAPNIWIFAAGMICYGFIGGGIDVSCTVQGGVVERATLKPLVSSLYGYFSLGALIGSFLSGIIAQIHVPIPAQFTVLAVLGIPTFIYLQRHLLPDEAQPAYAPKARRRFRISLPPRVLLPLGALVICVALGEESINNWVALYMRQELGANPAIAAFAYTAFAIATFGGRIFGDSIMQRVGVDRTLMTGSLAAATGIAFGIFVNQPWAMVMGYAIVGAGLSVVVPVTYRRAGEIPGMSPATAVATVASIGYIGFLAGPVLIGLIADAISLRFALALVATSLVGIFVLVRLSPSERSAEAIPAPALAPSLPGEENPLSL
ncbi:MAG TPA: MFS transporter [Thermomicrobiales bacterium]|nr:MFS transporter [Thermomicrobiales bacterium]